MDIRHVLVRLAEVSVSELRTLLEEAWRCQRPRTGEIAAHSH